MAKRAGKSAAADLGPATRVCVLFGKETFLFYTYTDALIARVEQSGEEVDVIRFDGSSAGAAEVLDECRSLGLMGQYKVVIVDNAEDFVKASDTPAGQKSARELLERYCEAPEDRATLVLRSETWRKGNLDKAVERVGAVVKCDEPNEAEAARMIAGRAKRSGAQIERNAAALLVERCGTGLGRLAGELDKLVAAARSENEDTPVVTRDLVEQLIGKSREEQVWDIQQPLLARSPDGALRLLDDLLTVSRTPTVLLRFAYTDLARKLHGASRGLQQGVPEFQLAKDLKLWGGMKDAVLRAARATPPDRLEKLLSECIETDVRGKTGQGDERRALEMLTVKFAEVVGQRN